MGERGDSMKRKWLPDYMPEHYDKFVMIILAIAGFCMVFDLTYKAFSKDETMFQSALFYSFILATVPMVGFIFRKLLKIKLSKNGIELVCDDDDSKE